MQTKRTVANETLRRFLQRAENFVDTDDETFIETPSEAVSLQTILFW